MSTIQLALVTELFYPHVGGQEVRYFDFCQELVAQGHEVDVFSLLFSKGLSLTEKIGRINVHRYAFSPHYVREASRDTVGVLNYSVQTGLRISTLPSFDAVIFNQWPLLPALFAEPLCHTTTIVDWCEPWPTGIANVLQKAVSHLPNGHITVSDFIRSWLIENYGIKPARIKSIPSAIRTSLYRPNPKDKMKGKVVFVGRLTKHKRPDILVEAIRMARKECRDITLDIVGPGPMFRMLKEKIGSDESGIRLHGFLTDEEKIRHLKEAWVLVLLSEREGFPRVVAEALAAGTPIITSDSPNNGTKYILNNTEAGIVCSPTPKEVASELVNLYNDTGRWEKMSNNALVSSTQFDLRNVTKQLVTFIRSLSGVD